MAVGLALGVTLSSALAACAPGIGLPEVMPTTPTTTAPFEPVPTITVGADGLGAPAVDATLAPLVPGPAPTERYVVSRREIAVTRDGRPLRTVILHPTVGRIGGEWVVPEGTFPLVLFSHGLRGSPEIYEQSLRTIASAGFVVAAPAYPSTSAAAAEYNPVDLINQPADASAVITAVLALNDAADDPLAGHLDPNRVGAMGHSAGGYTTMGLLSGVRDPRVRTAVVIAGGSMGGTFSAPPVPVLFVHGSADAVVPYRQGRATYESLPWPKAFLTIIDGGHADYLDRGAPATAAVVATVLDFLRATLYGDVDALARIPSAARVEAVTEFESTLAESR